MSYLLDRVAWDAAVWPYTNLACGSDKIARTGSLAYMVVEWRRSCLVRIGRQDDRLRLGRV
jgi:hypothetical protein